mmetsp:Transcript_15565/g.46970  ORF Transcript_15565/g.46970 Transcript_15565/m.46970 type:complete len:249 (+) Transcript_15565:1582-2328(+)
MPPWVTLSGRRLQPRPLQLQSLPSSAGRRRSRSVHRKSHSSARRKSWRALRSRPGTRRPRRRHRRRPWQRLRGSTRGRLPRPPARQLLLPPWQLRRRPSQHKALVAPSRPRGASFSRWPPRLLPPERSPSGRLSPARHQQTAPLPPVASCLTPWAPRRLACRWRTGGTRWRCRRRCSCRWPWRPPSGSCTACPPMTSSRQPRRHVSPPGHLWHSMPAAAVVALCAIAACSPGTWPGSALTDRGAVEGP